MMEKRQFARGARTRRATTLVALHCSGASGDMWWTLREAVGSCHRVLTPDLYGARNGPAWHGGRAFTLEDEVAPIIELIDVENRPVHLIGHSYGGAVALQAALARPKHVAGITLYEPAVFQLLKGGSGPEYSEIVKLAADIDAMLGRDDARGAMARFVTYWGGQGSWDGMRPDIQDALMRWAPKARLDFQALLSQPQLNAEYGRLTVPCLLLSGDLSPEPVRAVAQVLSTLMPSCRLMTLKGVGHMGPLTHKSLVAGAIVQHVGLLGNRNATLAVA